MDFLEFKMRGTDKLNICETFYIYVGQWRTGRSRVCVTLQSSRNDKKSSIDSRSILVRFSIGSRSFFVLPSFCLRSSFVRQSKIYRRTIEDLSKKQRKHNGATREQLKSGNEQTSNVALCAVRNVEWLPLAMLNVECWVLSYSRLKPAMTNYSVLNCFTPLQFNIKHLTLNIGTMPLAMLNFEFWIVGFTDFELWVLNYELRILNSQLSNSKCA